MLQVWFFCFDGGSLVAGRRGLNALAQCRECPAIVQVHHKLALTQGMPKVF